MMSFASAGASVLLAGLVASGDPSIVLRLQDPALTESSGLTVSQRHPGVLWTHADGGDAATVVAVNRRGRSVATVRLRGIDPYDPEALAPGRDGKGRPALFLGDLGDNRVRRPDVSVFRFTEPARLRDQTVDATWWQFTYPDGPRDAEALLVDPRDDRIYIATKDVFGGRLYRAPLHPRTDRTNRLTRIGKVPPLITDGAFLRDGRMVLRSYSTAYLYDRNRELVARELLPEQPQGESLAVDGDRLLVGSEGRRSAVYAVRLPVSDESPSSSPSPESSESRAAPPSNNNENAPERDRPAASRLALFVGVPVLLAVCALVLRRSRSRP